ncbi:MAG: hypothetical protein ACJLUP_04595 [Agrobacterium tumefaciens]
MSLMVDPLCQSRHQVSQVRAAKGIAVCDEKPAHLEQWCGRRDQLPMLVLFVSLLKHQAVLYLPTVYHSTSLIGGGRN